MDRDCNKCVYSTREGGCRKFKCEGTKTVEDIRAEVLEECKYNSVLFREIFLEELESQAVNVEEKIMYRNICSMAWNKYLEKLKEQKNGK